MPKKIVRLFENGPNSDMEKMRETELEKLEETKQEAKVGLINRMGWPLRFAKKLLAGLTKRVLTRVGSLPTSSYPTPCFLDALEFSLVPP